MPQEPGLIDKYIERSLQTRRELNEYAALMSTPYGSGTLTIHEILWDKPELELPQELREFHVTSPENIDSASLDTSINELTYLRKTYSSIFNDLSLDKNRITTIKKHYKDFFVIRQELNPKIKTLYEELSALEKRKQELINLNDSLSALSLESLITPTSPFNRISAFLKDGSEQQLLRIIASPDTSFEVSKWVRRKVSLDKQEKEAEEKYKKYSNQFHLDDRGFELEEIRDAAKELKITHFFSLFSPRWHKSKALFNDLHKIDDKSLRSAAKGTELLNLHKFLASRKYVETELKEEKLAQDALKKKIISKDNLLDGFDDILQNHISQELIEVLSNCATLPDSFRNGWIKYPESVNQFSQLAHKEQHLLEACLSNLTEMEVDCSSAFGKGMEVLDVKDLYSFYKEIANNSISLEIYMKWLQVERSIKDSTLNEFYKVFLQSQLSFDLIADCYKWVIRNAQAKDIYNEHSEALSRYFGGYLDQLRKKLRDDDKQISNLWENRLAAKIFQRMNDAPAGTNAVKVGNKTESSLVQHLITKPKSRVSVRHLFHKAHASILALKPCTLMSPMSVAQVLPLEETYDVLVIDEASQMKPEHALGSIARAKQVVIVGDENQLPPFSFGEAGHDDGSEEHDESILDMANTVFYPPRLLNRHYRSKHQDLIRFSNSEFYEGELDVPQTANTGAKNRGLEYRYVEDGCYENSTNEKEAKAIITEVLRLMRERKGESVGIVTMNAPQRDLLQILFDQKSQKSPEALDYLSYWKNKDQGINEFFIKNLERVQGDERDVMMVGTVYGPNKHRHVYQRFTAFTKDDGWRRLNVVVTRAKNQLFLFTSLKPQQIEDSQIRSRGVSVFQKYLGFAETKVLPPGKANTAEVESPFQQWAIDKIDSFPGYSADWEIGIDRFRIDIGVKHTDFPGYVMAVETDGKTYHSSASARDRDFLRQQILESHGWTFHRIWSTDWLEDPVGTKEKLKIALDNRIEQLKEQQNRKVSEKIETPSSDEKEQLDVESDLSSDDKKPTSQFYIEADIGEVIETDTGLFYKREYLPHLRRAVQHIIDVEGPLSHELLVKRVRLGHGYAKAGNPIKLQIKKAIPKGILVTSFGAETFYWPNDAKPESYRIGRKPQDFQLSNDEHRPVTQVCPEEIRAIAGIIQEDRFNLPQSEIAKEIVTFLGYSKCTAGMRKYIFEALDNEKDKEISS